MRLRALLATCVMLAVAVVGLRLASLAADARDAASLDRQREAVEVMARDAAGLLVLTQDYLLHATPRALRQWRAVHAELQAALVDYANAGAVQQQEVDDVIEVATNLPPLFDSLRSALEAAPGPATQARRETLADQLLNETRRISDGAFEVSHLLTERRSLAARQQRTLAVVTQLLMLTLTLWLAWVLLRRVLEPLARLQRGALAVQSGDLTARIGHSSADELGELSGAFDAMTASLQERAAELQSSNQRLGRSEAFLERAGRIAGVGGWEYDLGSEQMIWSEQTRRIHEVATDFTPTLDNALAFYPPAARASLQAAIDAATASGSGWDLELPFTTARGRTLWVRATGTAELREGHAVRLAGAFQDISARRAADDVLREAMQAAQAASEAKTIFLANMSHEIRTPMNAVIGLSYLLQHTQLDDEQRELLGKIHASSRALLEVINDVLDLSKIEAGEMEFEQAPFDLGLLLNEVLGVFAAQARQRGLLLRPELAVCWPRQVLGDAARLRQVLSNLLANALKFTPHGSVTLSVGAAEPPAAPAPSAGAAPPLWLRFAVQDSGIGMDAQVQARLFTPFTQADASTTRRFGGTGLGLSIVKRLVVSMGGKVEVHSMPGQGSCFEVVLPFEPAPAGHDSAPALRPIEVLVGHAQGARRDAWVTLCQQLGWRTGTVATGEAAREQAHERRGDASGLDVLLVDGRLPGLAALSSLTDAGEGAAPAHAPAVVIVGHDYQRREVDLLETALAGELLNEPLEASALFNAVHAAIARRGGDTSRLLLASSLDEAGLARLPGVHVLVVDDSDINLEVARRVLQREDAQVSMAHDGAEAVALLRQPAHGIDAVLMDVQMPVLDGLEATRLIRGDVGLPDLPVIGLSAGALLSERQRALDAGMNSFVSKPFEPQALVTLLYRHVSQARRALLPVLPRGPACHAAASARWPAIAGIDMADVQRRLSGDLALFQLVLRQTCNDFQDLVPTPDDDSAPLAARLHKLAGSAGLLGATALWQAARTAETTWRHGPVAQRASAMAATLTALQALQAASAAWIDNVNLSQTTPALAAATSTLDHAALHRWRDQLEARDFTALDEFKALAPALGRQLGEPALMRVEAALQSLRFDQVLTLINPLL